MMIVIMSMMIMIIQSLLFVIIMLAIMIVNIKVQYKTIPLDCKGDLMMIILLMILLMMTMSKMMMTHCLRFHLNCKSDLFIAPTPRVVLAYVEPDQPSTA